MQQCLYAGAIITHLLANFSFARINLSKLPAVIDGLEDDSLNDGIFEAAVLGQRERLAQYAAIFHIIVIHVARKSARFFHVSASKSTISVGFASCVIGASKFITAVIICIIVFPLKYWLWLLRCNQKLRCLAVQRSLGLLGLNDHPDFVFFE